MFSGLSGCDHHRYFKLYNKTRRGKKCGKLDVLDKLRVVCRKKKASSDNGEAAIAVKKRIVRLVYYTIDGKFTCAVGKGSPLESEGEGKPTAAAYGGTYSGGEGDGRS